MCDFHVSKFSECKNNTTELGFSCEFPHGRIFSEPKQNELGFSREFPRENLR